MAATIIRLNFSYRSSELEAASWSLRRDNPVTVLRDGNPALLPFDTRTEQLIGPEQFRLSRGVPGPRQVCLKLAGPSRLSNST